MTTRSPRTAAIGPILLVLGMLAVTGAILYGTLMGGGWSEVRELVTFPWFNVTLVDLYVGFALFAAWIVRRETSTLRAVTWIVLLLGLGNVVACFYALQALVGSRGDAAHFWMGSPSA
ncbi:MAG: DUF1475 family protein [Planctomycetota bacterium]|jgi:hypothetical protein